MKPEIKTLTEKKLIGKRIIMSFTKNKTYELWRNFMPRRKEIQNNIGTELYSIEVYAPFYFNN
jgi:AraC family transcriptional regulator